MRAVKKRRNRAYNPGKKGGEAMETLTSINWTPFLIVLLSALGGALGGTWVTLSIVAQALAKSPK